MTELLPWHQVLWDKLKLAREQGRIPHALLMTGPAGLGKSEYARLLANALVCESPDAQGMPCGSCRQCKLVAAGSHPDIKELSPEEAGKAIKVDAIRELVGQSILTVKESSYQVFIIHPAEAMGVAAANALLKTLEEPVERTLLILISANPGQLLATIKSRCQQIVFAMPPGALALNWLSQQSGLDQRLASELLQLARGAPLLARQMSEGDDLQCYHQLLKEFLQLSGNAADPVRLAEQWQKQQSLKLLLSYMKRWLMDLIRLGNGAGMIDNASSVPVEDLKTLANRLDLVAVYSLLDNLFETERQLVNNINPQLALEQLLLHWVRINRKGVT